MSSFFEDLKKNEERLQEIASSVVKYAKRMALMNVKLVLVV